MGPYLHLLGNRDSFWCSRIKRQTVCSFLGQEDLIYYQNMSPIHLSPEELRYLLITQNPVFVFRNLEHL